MESDKSTSKLLTSAAPKHVTLFETVRDELNVATPADQTSVENKVQDQLHTVTHEDEASDVCQGCVFENGKWHAYVHIKGSETFMGVPQSKRCFLGAFDMQEEARLAASWGEEQRHKWAQQELIPTSVECRLELLEALEEKIRLLALSAPQEGVRFWSESEEHAILLLGMKQQIEAAGRRQHEDATMPMSNNTNVEKSLETTGVECKRRKIQLVNDQEREEREEIPSVDGERNETPVRTRLRIVTPAQQLPQNSGPDFVFHQVCPLGVPKGQSFINLLEIQAESFQVRRRLHVATEGILTEMPTYYFQSMDKFGPGSLWVHNRLCLELKLPGNKDDGQNTLTLFFSHLAGSLWCDLDQTQSFLLFRKTRVPDKGENGKGLSTILNKIEYAAYKHYSIKRPLNHASVPVVAKEGEAAKYENIVGSGNARSSLRRRVAEMELPEHPLQNVHKALLRAMGIVVVTHPVVGRMLVARRHFAAGTCVVNSRMPVQKITGPTEIQRIVDPDHPDDSYLYAERRRLLCYDESFDKNDPVNQRNLWYLVNHDSDPTCDIRIAVSGIQVIARRHICRGEVLTWCYNKDYWGSCGMRRIVEIPRRVGVVSLPKSDSVEDS